MCAASPGAAGRAAARPRRRDRGPPRGRRPRPAAVAPLRLAGLPLGDPTQREVAARLPGSLVATERSSRLVDELDDVAAVVRTRDPRALDRELPGLLEREPDPRARVFLRSTARLHAAIGGVELAVVPGDDGLRAALLTLIEGADRWPWWGFSDLGGLRTELGAPLVSLTARARDRR
jgi:hypothetical protein